MLTKTNTLKSSQSTSITSYYSEAAFRSPERTRKIKNDNTEPLLTNDCKFQVNPEIILIRKENKIHEEKKRLPLSPISKRLSVTSLANKVIIQKTELKLFDMPNEIKPILKKSSILNKTGFINNHKVRFADEEEKRPLAYVYMVESYRNYKMYSLKANDENNKEIIKHTKNVCRCSCVIY
jgi:hypothetical protein